jgi:hypothetical protein
MRGLRKFYIYYLFFKVTSLKYFNMMFQCCKEESYEDNDNGATNSRFGGCGTKATTTKKPSQVDLDYYDMYDKLFEENPNCRKCSSAEIEAERGNADSGDDVDYDYDYANGDLGDLGDGESDFGDC